MIRTTMISAMVLSTLLFTSCNNQKNKVMETKIIFPQGEKAPTDYFKGTAWINTLVPESDSLNYIVGDVVFEAGARNNWHTHPAKQILLVTEGKGWYQEKGEAARVIAKGDVVVVPPFVEHWHGAARDSRFVHIAITNFADGKNVEWLQPVTDEEYDKL